MNQNFINLFFSLTLSKNIAAFVEARTQLKSLRKQLIGVGILSDQINTIVEHEW